MTLSGASPSIQARFAESATINSQILGSGGLTMSGGGYVRLGNGAYTGTTTLANGAVVVSSAAALGGTGAIEITETNAIPGSATTIAYGGGSLVLDGSASPITISRDINLQGKGEQSVRRNHQWWQQYAFRSRDDVFRIDSSKHPYNPDRWNHDFRRRFGCRWYGWSNN